jgi:hypothetical protein
MLKSPFFSHALTLFFYFSALYAVATPVYGDTFNTPRLAETKFLANVLKDEKNSVCVKKICAPEKVRFFEKDLLLRGHELFSYYFFKIYVASFYSENLIPSLSEVFSVPGDKHLRLQYLRGIKAQDFIDSSEDAFRANPDINPDEIRNELKLLYAAYEDIEKGDTYSLYFSQKDMTTCLFKNNISKVCIEGEAFAFSYFSIWLSEYSLNNEFSKKLISFSNN